MITGLDLVEWQLEVSPRTPWFLPPVTDLLQVAAGNPLPLSQSAIPLVGHAFEARIYAENPRNNFLPDSGSLLHLSTPEPTHTFAPSLPSPSTSVQADSSASLARTVDTSTAIEPSLRLEQGFGAGAQIGVFYDPMIAKLVVHGRDRTEALRVLRKALEKYEVVGVSTNIEFLRTLAANESFINAELETGFIPVSECTPGCVHLTKPCPRNISTSYSHHYQSPQPSYLLRLHCTSSYETSQQLRRPPLG